MFIIDFTKEHSVNLQKWGNRYLIRADDLTEAISAVPLFEDLERGAHSEGVAILQARVATVAANDGLYLNVPLDWVGTQATDDVILPLITTMNLEIIPDGFGRPSRKYYHPCVGPSLCSTTLFQQWLPTFLSDVRDAMIATITACNSNSTPLVDPDDQPLTEAVIAQRQFGFHQFHKRSPRTPS